MSLKIIQVKLTKDVFSKKFYNPSKPICTEEMRRLQLVRNLHEKESPAKATNRKQKR